MKKIGIIILLICSILITVGCEKKDTKKQTETTQTEMGNPLTEVSTKEELEKLVGYSVPTIEDKEIITYIAIGQKDDKEQARILYQDGSEFDMRKGKIKNQEEVSGIYEAKEKETIKLEKISVKIYEYEETIFGVWKDKNYSYSYSMQNTDIDVLKSNIEKLIEKE